MPPRETVSKIVAMQMSATIPASSRTSAPLPASSTRAIDITTPTTRTEASKFGSPTVPVTRLRSPAAVRLVAAPEAFGAFTNP